MSGGLEAEAPLWALFDALGLPFRQTRGDLVARYGTRACAWSDGFRECEVPCKALLPGLSAFRFNVIERADPTEPPEYFVADYRANRHRLAGDLLRDDRALRNFADVLGAVQTRLGPGADVSVSNTRAQAWAFGAAVLTLSAYPPHLQTQPRTNSRHAVDPMAAHEASLSFESGWMAPLSPQELGWIADFRPLHRGVLQPWLRMVGWHRWPPELGTPSDGFGPSADGLGFVVAQRGNVRVLARADLLAVCLGLFGPARGLGMAVLGVRHAPVGQTGVRAREITLRQVGYALDALAEEAAQLAEALALPIERVLGKDD